MMIMMMMMMIMKMMMMTMMMMMLMLIMMMMTMIVIIMTDFIFLCFIFTVTLLDTGSKTENLNWTKYTSPTSSGTTPNSGVCICIDVLFVHLFVCVLSIALCYYLCVSIYPLKAVYVYLAIFKFVSIFIPHSMCHRCV